MDRKFMKGCEAIAEAAVRAGCRFFAGYPITPQNEIPEYMARQLPNVGGTFVQGESEVASVNMIYGAASTGTLSMTSSSSPGISLKSEGISYLAGARLPSVVVSVMRAGPGIGTIQPAQTDYLQATKASGHGGFKTIVLAPGTLQEAVDFTYKAFEYAQRDRNPVIVAPDGFLGAIMEPVELPPYKELPETPGWATVGSGDRDHINIVLSGNLLEKDQQIFNEQCAKMYERWAKEDVQVEEYMVEDAEYILTAYGTSGRICKSAVDALRNQGIKVGLIRPITINPFPYESFKKLDEKQVKCIIDVEMAIPAQMIEDVKLGTCDRIPIDTVLTSGGIIIPQKAVIEKVLLLAKEGQ
ncbi:3-methyl-2-oxobutanoate dehydrogenase subunit VorB [Sedimentibacter sp. B4]|uniref:3-methyl-2-oxobutanoate dehydrogenase subunit VorB n=1 Tax=Sedimentibacter sp. B4 TaxID=304766 RepID=UPI0002D55A73|nr:3-methyl-2-oxobutanoate dehydrogenase subunit VorB [Sedimentibacter sp. B4]